MSEVTELHARIVAQQQFITALHSALVEVRAALPLPQHEAMRARIDGALDMSEPAGHIELALAVADVVARRADEEIDSRVQAALDSEVEKAVSLERGGADVGIILKA